MPWLCIEMWGKKGLIIVDNTLCMGVTRGFVLVTDLPFAIRQRWWRTPWTLYGRPSRSPSEPCVMETMTGKDLSKCCSKSNATMGLTFLLTDSLLKIYTKELHNIVFMRMRSWWSPTQWFVFPFSKHFSSICAHWCHQWCQLCKHSEAFCGCRTACQALAKTQWQHIASAWNPFFTDERKKKIMKCQYRGATLFDTHMCHFS